MFVPPSPEFAMPCGAVPELLLLNRPRNRADLLGPFEYGFFIES